MGQASSFIRLLFNIPQSFFACNNLLTEAKKKSAALQRFSGKHDQ